MLCGLLETIDEGRCCVVETIDEGSSLRFNSDEEAIVSLEDIFGPSSRSLLLALRAREAQTATQWWEEQASILKIADGWNSSVQIPKQFPLVSFSLLLEALVPPDQRTNFALNIGGGDGKTHDPLFPLFSRYGYGGVIVEGDGRLEAELVRNLSPYNKSGSIVISMDALRPSRVTAFVRRYKIPSNLDALKIDIDSCDLEIAWALLESGLRPKIVAVEINPDIPPPFQWHLKQDRHYGMDFQDLALYGIYGGSADYFFQLMSVKYGYSLVAFEFIDPRNRCIRCDHNMWFVRGDLVGNTMLSWEGMVRLFWNQVELLNYWCLHVELIFSCPLRDITGLALLTGASGFPQAEQSFMLSLPKNRQLAFAYLHTLQKALQERCALETCGRYDFSPLCIRSACPSFADVSSLVVSADS